MGNTGGQCSSCGVAQAPRILLWGGGDFAPRSIQPAQQSGKREHSGPAGTCTRYAPLTGSSSQGVPQRPGVNSGVELPNEKFGEGALGPTQGVTGQWATPNFKLEVVMVQRRLTHQNNFEEL